MTGATGNIYAGLHEFADMMLPLHLLRPGDLFLDVGANVGSYTVLASGVRQATTWAFEPDPETARMLRRNIAVNSLESHVIVHELALGDVDGEVAFTHGLDTMNRVANPADSQTRSVASRRLDSLIGTHRPLMLKLDVEGHEEQVIRGAHQLLASDALKVIAIESRTEAIDEIFRGCGFERAYYDPFTRALTTTPSEIPASNAVFVKDWSFLRERLSTAPPVHVLGRSI